MQNKSRNWTDVQLIISSISIALTLGFWSVLASRDKVIAGAAGDATLPDATDTPAVTQSMLVPGQKFILTSASSAQAPAATNPLQPRRAKDRGSGGTGSGGGGGSVATTKSS